MVSNICLIWTSIFVPYLAYGPYLDHILTLFPYLEAIPSYLDHILNIYLYICRYIYVICGRVIFAPYLGHVSIFGFGLELSSYLFLKALQATSHLKLKSKSRHEQTVTESIEERVLI